MRIFYHIFWYLSLSLLLGSHISAQERPKIGLALSGGGAKGFAHVGVLKVIEEVGLPIDYITGTSMGSIIGGLYAIGYDAQYLEDLVLHTDWLELLNDNLGRHALGMEQKLWDARYLASLPIQERKVRLPSGLVAGQKINRLLSRLTLPAHHIQDFTKLPIPFACVATDIVTGEAVILNEGFLPEAMRASMAIPSILTTVKIGNHILLDGGLVRNLPGEDVRNMGADFVIGVDVSAPLHPEEELGSFVNILDQAISFMGVASTINQRQLCDLLILPDIEGLSVGDFSKVDSLIERGERAARQMIPQLRLLADSLTQFATINPKPLQAHSDSVYIHNITIDGLERISRGLVHAELGMLAPDCFSIEDIEKATDRVYSSQFFESVTYRIEPITEGAKLTIKVVEKSEDLFRFGLRYDSSTEASVLLSTLFRNVARRSSFLNLDLILGQRIILDGESYFHLGLWPHIGMRARLNYSDVFLDIFNESQREATLDVKAIVAEGLIGSIFSTKGAAGVGFRAEYADVSPRVAAADTFSFNDKLFSFLGLIWLDTFDRADFPTSGMSLVIRNDLANKNFGSDATFTRHYFDLRAVLPLHRKVSLGSTILLGTTTGADLPLHQKFILGGLETPLLLLGDRLLGQSFVGLKAQELIGNHVQFFQFSLQYEMFPQIFTLLRLNAGNTFENWKLDFSKDRFESGLGLTLGAITPLGPIELSLARGSRHNFLTHLNIGYKF